MISINTLNIEAKPGEGKPWGGNVHTHAVPTLPFKSSIDDVDEATGAVLRSCAKGWRTHSHNEGANPIPAEPNGLKPRHGSTRAHSEIQTPHPHRPHCLMTTKKQGCQDA